MNERDEFLRDRVGTWPARRPGRTPARSHAQRAATAAAPGLSPVSFGTCPAAAAVPAEPSARAHAPASFARPPRTRAPSPAGRVVRSRLRAAGTHPSIAARRPRLAAPGRVDHFRPDQAGAVGREPRGGPIRGGHSYGPARQLQDRRAGQGRGRQDDRRGQRRVDLRRTAPGRPGGGHRRRHRVRQAGQPDRPATSRLVLGAGRRPEPATRFADVRSPGRQQHGRACSCSRGSRPRRGAGCWIRRSTGRPPRGSTAISRSRSSTAARPWTRRSPRRCCGDLDALIVVSSPWVDGASAAGQDHGMAGQPRLTGLLHRTVVVLNDSDGHADKRTRVIAGAAVRQPRPAGGRGALRSRICGPAASST